MTYDITETGYSNGYDLRDINDEYQGISDYIDDNPQKKKQISDKQREQLLAKQEELRR